MRKIVYKIAFVFLALLLLVSYRVYDRGGKNEVLLQALVESLSQIHFDPRNIDDTFSEEVYKEYIDRLDYSKRFLMQSDLEQLNAYKTAIDDQINASSFEFFDLSEKIIVQRIKEANDYYTEILSKPFDFSTKEKIETDPEKIEFAKDTEELKDRWRKLLKYQTLTKLTTALELQEKLKEKKDSSYVEKTFEEQEKKARESVKEAQDRWFNYAIKLETDDWRWRFINAITYAYDPHTNFLPPKEKEDFDIGMTGQLEGIGATLQEQDGYVKVVKIVPGSPSWNEGNLKAGDKIIKVAQGNEEAVDIVDMRLDNAVRLIRGKKGTEVKLTLMKIDGSIQEISIIRDVIQLEETYAKSAVLSTADNSKVGYVYLPKFYVNFNNNKGRHCSEDVRIEIEKLKKDNIKGLVIDLRNNGGGSLRDVVDMAGLFIDKGPVVQVKSRFGGTEVLEDKARGLVYDGPLVIMVNSLSASASEILAAAMQDYERAVIVGTTTYGKGTVQRIIDLDNVVRGMDDIKPLGALKVTMQKFYRINGGATQLKGVTPDIVLPDAYSYIDIGEKELENALKWDKIQSAKYASTNKLNGMQTARENSAKRVSHNTTFELIDESAVRLKQLKDDTEYTLQLKEYLKEKKKREKESEKFEAINKVENSLTIASPLLDINEMKTDTLLKTRRDSWNKSLKKDIYLDEIYSILKDLN